MRQPVQVLVYPSRVVCSGREYLLLRRIASRGGHWQGVTGGVEDDESLEETAKRELFEETGFVSSALKQTEYSYSFPIRDEWRDMYAAGVETIVEYVFVAVVDSGQEPAITWEHDEWQWCSCSQALRLLKWPENIEALKRCDSYLNVRLDADSVD